MHNTFGIGTIAWYGGKPQNNNKYIKVEFDGKKLELSFPSCFETHLTALEKDFAKIIEQELAKTKIKPKEIQEQAFFNKKIYENKKYVNTEPAEKDKTPPPKYARSLVFGRCYGTNSRNIYLDCCDWFGWDKNQKDNFGRQGALLYAKRGTPEGYSPWFVTHHNLTQTKGGEWRNTIDGDYIHEEWDNCDERMWEDKTIRVVFIIVDGKYYFYGLYRVYKIEMNKNCKYTKTYERIKENYFR